MGIRVETLYYDLEARTETLAKGFGAAERRMQQFAGLVKRHPVAALGGLVATMVLIGAEAAKMAVGFDGAMRRVTALLPDAAAKLEDLKARVIDLSSRTPFDAQALAAALRTVVEVGGREMREPAMAMGRLELATRGALATGEDMSGIIRTLDGVMDAFGLSGNRAAAEVLDLTVKAGQAGVPFSALGGILESVAPSAAAAGVPLANLVAMIVALDDIGVPAGQQVRMLRQEFTGLQDAADGLDTQLDKQLGVTIKRVGDTYVLAGRGAEAFAAAQREVADASGAAARAAKHTAAGANLAWKQFINTFTARALTVGGTLAGLVNDFLAFDERMEEWWRRQAGRVLSPGGVLGTVMGAAFAAGPRSGPVPEPGLPTPPRRRHVATEDELRAARAAAKARLSLMDDLRDRVSQLMGDTYAITVRQLDAIEAQFREKFGTRIPEEVTRGLERLRGAALGDVLVSNLGRQMDALAEKTQAVTGNSHATTEEYQAQLAALAAQRDHVQRMLDDENLSTEQRDRYRATLGQIADLEQRVLAAKQGQASTGKVLAHQDEDRLGDLQAQARNIEAAARGALQLASAFGLADEKTAATLENVAQLAANIPSLIAAIAKGGTAGIIGAALPVVGAIAGIVQGLLGGGGESPEEQARREALQKNSEAIEALTRQIGEFGLNLTGTQVANVQTALDVAFRPVGRQAYPGIPGGIPVENPDPLGTFRAQMTQLGITAQDLRTVFAELGLEFDGTLDTLEELKTLARAIAQVELARFAETFAGQMTALQAEFELFDITDPIRQLEKLRTTMSAFSPAIAEALAGLDLTKAEDRATLEARLQAILGQMQAGTLTAEQLGNMTAQQLLDAILQLESTVDEANQDAGDVTGTANIGVNRSVTEVTASRLGALLTTDVYWNQQTAQATQRMANFLESLLVSAGIQPPTQEELDRYQGAGELTVTFAPGAIQIVIGGPATPALAQTVGMRIGEAAMDVIDRELGRRSRVRARAAGRTILN
jgi:hypothetical protein